jgi:very-short-patch-repair endonuclease
VLHGFIVDFYCPALNLILELDGGHHGDTKQASYDADRTAWLTGAGYQVIRLRNADLTRERIRDEIMKILRTDLALSSPSPHCGEGVRG